MNIQTRFRNPEWLVLAAETEELDADLLEEDAELDTEELDTEELELEGDDPDFRLEGDEGLQQRRPSEDPDMEEATLEERIPTPLQALRPESKAPLLRTRH